jgi:hypothetical protein
LGSEETQSENHSETIAVISSWTAANDCTVQ